ncbi:MAG TPA: hypothetical protein P5056_00790 [Candidatus Paceibacterota bacterium]|nr:hypothetical protein [Candidatus Paceibacterota bacterium]
MNKLNQLLWVLVFVVVVMSISGIAFFFVNNSAESSYTNLDEFAQCLTNKGAAMYGAAWCSHCAAQKERFGSSFKYATYVECPDNINACTDKGVLSYPTWILGDGTKLVGEQNLEKLSELTSCELKK